MRKLATDSGSDSEDQSASESECSKNSDDSRAGTNGSGSDNSGSESGSDSSSGSSSENGSNSDEAEQSGDESNKEEKNGEEEDDNLNASRSSFLSQSSSSSNRSSKENIKKCWERNPDIYGIRRSGRERKQPERIAIEETDNGYKKNKRRVSSQWHSSEESASDASDSDANPRRRPPPPKKTKKAYRKSDSDDSPSKHSKRTVRVVGSKVSYKEESEGEDDNEDLVEVDWSDTKPEDANVQTIEKIVRSRIGKKGAVGMQTYVYEVEIKGDPNSDYDPDDPSQIERQFLVKWKGWAHVHNTWESEESLKTQKVKGYKKLENCIRKLEDLNYWKSRASPEEIEYMEIQAEMERDLYISHLQADRIFAEAVENGNTYFYVKWQNLPYSEATWELEDLVTSRFPVQLEAFRERERSSCFPKQSPALKHRPKFSPCKLQPDFLGGDSEDLILRDYQLDGLNWLINAWCKHNSCILADEMGLGKTIQSIAFVSYLFHVHNLYGPFLFVLPLSTLNAWQKEFAQWAPDMNVIVYLGDRDSRRIIQEYEWTFSSKRIKFNVVLTTYEILLRDKEVLHDSCSWAALLIDEAHRLKNEESQLYHALEDFKTNHRVLITGTPLQNSLKELWALLHFIMPDKFDDWEYFESQHDGENMKKGFHRLHRQLEPYLLRRVKKDVEKSLPAKVEQILRVDMTQLQKQYYKWILTKNYNMLKKGTRGSTTSFVNIVMELKKCCNHASLTKPPEENFSSQNEIVTQLLRGSGKLMLLDKLLVRLNETGHRVLIFSQMVRMLDILAQYLQFRRFPFQRLDGSISGDLRRQALDHFNAEGSSDFCFLLSTRAGGLGINLATADTVIIFDSDWNPQNDLQAQARAHRIGQKNQVNIYRLVTKNSIEETIIERAKQKMVLDHLVIQSMDTSGRTVFNKKINTSTTPFNKDELNSILKFGAEELFKDDDEHEEEPVCDIDEILRRAETRDEGPSSVGDDLLSAFKVASFNLDEEEEVSKLDSAQDENTTDWDEIIPEKFRNRVQEEVKQKELASLYMLPRKRKTLNQNGKETASESPRKRHKKDSESSEEEASDEERPRKRGRPRMHHKETVKGFTDPEVRRFFKSFKKFSNPMRRLDTIATDADMREKSMDELTNLGLTILERCKETLTEHRAALKEHNAANNGVKRRDRGPSFKLSGVTINVKTTMTTLDELSPLDKVVPHAPVERASWTLPVKRVKDAHWDCSWGIVDDSRLLRGIYEYGMGSWEQLKGDPALNLGDKILLESNLKPQGKHLENRAQYLLKILRKNLNLSLPKTSKPRGPKSKLKKVKEPKGISKEIIENDDTSDDEATNASNASSKKNMKEEKKLHVKDIKIEVKDEMEEPEKSENIPREKIKKKKKEKDRKPSLGPVHITANGEPTPLDSTHELDQHHPLWPECKEKMRPMKKALKALDNPNSSLSREEQIQHTRKCLIQIGDHIERALSQYDDHQLHKEWKHLLWQFVSKFTEYDAKKLHKLYKQHKKFQEDKKEDDALSLPIEHKKDHKKRRDDDERSHKRRHEEDSNSQNNKPYNGWPSNDRNRDSGSSKHSRQEGSSKDGGNWDSRDRNYRGQSSSSSRDWHSSSSSNRESRYPQDFNHREGNYHRGDSYKSHGYHHRGGEWRSQHGGYGNYPAASRYPHPNMYGNMRDNSSSAPSYRGSSNRHDWGRGSQESDRKKDPRQHDSPSRHDRY